jgi:hypothetical protein
MEGGREKANNSKNGIRAWTIPENYTPSSGSELE